MTELTISQAIEITKIAVAGHNAPWINEPEKVTEFIETVAKKIHELRAQKA